MTSRGVALADTPDGNFARLAAEVALSGVAPVPLLALLKHPRGGFDPGAVGALERAILRGPRPRRGSAGLQGALAGLRQALADRRAGKASSLHRSDQRLALTKAELDAADAILARLTTALAPLETLPRGAHPMAAIASRHAQVVDALGGMTAELAHAFEQIEQAGTLVVAATDYAELFHAAIADTKVYDAGAGARVHIFGLLEARLQTVDRLVLGGLVEGVWPPETRGDPWLSRPMRHTLGLDLPERRIGLSAHDFAQALGAPEVILSRAAKLAGAPTVPSRFVQRLAAVAGKARWEAALTRGTRYAALARQIDETGAPEPAKRPAPTPKLEARPRQLSVTEIEDLLRDPYTIYAKHVLKLPPLDPIDAPPGAAERGSVIHDAIGAFGKTYPEALPDDPAQTLTEIGRGLFKPLSEFPEVRAFWWPRFQRIAQWFAGFERARRPNVKKLAVEIGGSIPIPFGKESFTLTVRADRIECLADGRYAILDYKTGAPPSEPQVRTGLSPQLTLEAAILRQGGFKDFPPGGSVAELLYVRLRGGAVAGEECPINFKQGTPDEQADRAIAALAKVLGQFADPAKPYYSLLHPMWSNSLRHLRPSRARAGMVAHRRRQGRRGRHMSGPGSIPPAVIERQTEASDPQRSAWVSANAGSGKTHVLAQRVIRLLLSGVDPARILCITFTKAAAANMANKVFQDLRDWTLLDDTGLDAAMRKAGVKKIDTALRTRARQLFALALETPGGLKVQTIHAFCTQLLHLFPFEANVPARFEVLDEITETQMLGKLSLDVLLEAAEAPDSALGRALGQAVLAAADITFQDMVREAIRARDALTRWVDAAGGLPQAMAQLSQALGVGPDETVSEVDAEIFMGSVIAESEWAAIGAALGQGLKTDKEQGARFTALAALPAPERLDRYIDIFCTKKRDKTKERIATSTVEKVEPDLCRRLNEERDRVWGLLQRKRAVEARDRSSALFTIAHAVILRLRAEKNRRGLLDYDDLIDKTLDLLQEERAAWVHYKLDRGIHHVLIDEAQDTSQKQWEIVKALVSEFFAGRGAHERQRTIFAVGDEKQSIFSFQGASPREFAAMRRHFETAHRHASLDFVVTDFKHSFRSGPNVLGAVDTVFAQAHAYAGLSANSAAPVHEALPDKAPGLVEIWGLEKSDDRDTIEGWDAPFDTQTVTSGVAKLASRIAATVAAWLRQGRRPKDVLILLRRRGVQFEAIIRALKRSNIAVAGADRLTLTDHIAVMDLMVLAEALLLPQDDLALATVLKSPLFGLDDDALFALAWNRKGSLHAALEAREPDLAARLAEMRDMARAVSPFAFFAWLLGAAKGRKQILARLGHEAADALDEFLNLALDYERAETPSLQGFIAWLRAAETQVKRDMEMERDEVRVMTVHGAKGLEAPIVILADTTTPPQGWHPPRLLQVPATGAAPGAPDRMIWAGPKDHDVGPMADARQSTLAAAAAEYRRLLYVAMTRAIERLVVCGVDNGRKRPEGCWYQLVHEALADGCTTEMADDGINEVLRFRKTPEETAPVAAEADEAIAPVSAPPWLHQPVAAAPPRRAPMRPSGAAAPWLPDAPARQTALLRGSLTHRLLQSLPDIPFAQRKPAMLEYLARAGANLNDTERKGIAEQVLRVLDDPRFAALYGPGSRAEVPIIGRVQSGGELIPVSGAVDRLAVTQTSVLIADFKTDQQPPRRLEKVPADYLRQLALYRAVLVQLYPDRPVRAALIWTEVPDLMEFSNEALDAALARVTAA